MRMLSGLIAVLMLAAGCNGDLDAKASDKDEPKHVLVVTGNDYPGHKWKLTTPVLTTALGADKRMAVTVTEEPNDLATLDLSDYDTLVLHFMDWETPDPDPTARRNLKNFVRSGGGLVLVHFACGAFQEWDEFGVLAGRAWDPNLRGHDPHGAFTVEIADETHPVTRGLTAFETTDELYTCLAGETPIHIVATAQSKVDHKDYPIAFVLQYGQGKVFHCVLGHDVKALANPPVGELFRRGTAWTAGLVPTLPRM